MFALCMGSVLLLDAMLSLMSAFDLLTILKFAMAFAAKMTQWVLVPNLQGKEACNVSSSPLLQNLGA